MMMNGFATAEAQAEISYRQGKIRHDFRSAARRATEDGSAASDAKAPTSTASSSAPERSTTHRRWIRRTRPALSDGRMAGRS